MLATRRHRFRADNGRRFFSADNPLSFRNRKSDQETFSGPPVVAPVEGLIQALRQLAEVIACLSPDQYTTRPMGAVASSIGCHVRHCLDHVDAFLKGIRTGRLDYDQRQRGTSIEHDRHAAFDLIVRMEDQLRDMDPACLSDVVSVRATPLAHGPGQDVCSSVGRELSFVQSHTVHHQAIIAMTCSILGVDVPDRFGYAPATIAHLEQTACARSPSSG
jgi:uncharacterized damage-inducible protein DinB